MAMPRLVPRTQLLYCTAMGKGLHLALLTTLNIECGTAEQQSNGNLGQSSFFEWARVCHRTASLTSRPSSHARAKVGSSSA